MEKKSKYNERILPVLRKMEIGEIEEWDVKRYFAVDKSIQVVQIQEDKKFTRRKNFTSVQVKRLA